MIAPAKSNSTRLAHALGWFSIGLGLAQILAPRRISKLIGVKNRPVLFRFLGAREILSGIGILSQKGNRGLKTGLRSRVGGDIMDLGLLGAALHSKHSTPRKVLATTAAVAGVTALDTLCSRRFTTDSSIKETGIHVRKTITINRSPEELYSFWRDFSNLTRFMSHVDDVQIIDEKRSHWKVKGPAGRTIEWDADIINETPNRLIAWRTVEGAEVEHSGSVRFEPASAGRGTVVKVEFQYSPPAKALGAAVAKLFGRSPEQEVERDLRQFKQIMETGEITTTAGQPAGRPSSTSKKYDYVPD